MSAHTTQRQSLNASNFAKIASLALTGTLVGFFVVSYLPGALDVDNRLITVPFRGLMLGFLLYTGYRWISMVGLCIRMSPITLLALFFGTSYCTRFIADAALLQVQLGSPPSDMALYLFGMCVPTFIIFYLINDITLYRKALVWAVIALGACCLVSALWTRTATVSSGAGHQANSLVSHIEYGHMGVTTMILGLFLALNVGRSYPPWYLRLSAVVAVSLGIFTLLAASSRGALVAGILLIPFVLYLGIRYGSKLGTIGICVVFVVLLSVTISYLARNGEQVIRQIASASAYSSASESIYARQVMMGDAWHQYLMHPWLGSSIVERNSLSYPHNSIVEAFMATGTFGGTAFVLLVLLATHRAFRLIKYDPVTAWIPLCFFQQLAASMFSGGLYANMPLWGMMAIMLGAESRRMYATADRPQIQFAS